MSTNISSTSLRGHDQAQGVAENWEARAAAKRDSCLAAIPQSWKLPQSVMGILKYPLETSKNNLIELDIPRRSGILTDRELDITTSYDVPGLLKNLTTKEFSPLAVTIAFSKRAAIAQQLLRDDQRNSSPSSSSFPARVVTILTNQW